MSPAALRNHARSEQAIRYAGAICATEKRAAEGYCAASTARTHVRALWAKIDAEGLRARVEDALPAVQARTEYQAARRA